MTEPMHLHPAVRPGLAAGSYELRTSQRIVGATLGDRAVDARVQHVEVTAPRTTMAPGEVFGVVPPPHAQGPFESRLPHIALKRRTLPWDRSDPVETNKPWLALVMLAEGEATFIRGADAVDCYSDTVAEQLDDLDTSVRGDCIEVTKTVLERTFPALDELELLCHVREADARDTELADEDNWVSVVLCNRLPMAGTAYRCMLISLEGQLQVLPKTGGVVETPTRVGAWDGILELAEVPRVERIIGGNFTVFSPTVESTRRTNDSVVGAATGPTVTASAATTEAVGAEGGFVRLDVNGRLLDTLLAEVGIIEPKFRFPVLATWEFECSEVPGDFGGLMARINVALLSDANAPQPDPRRVLPVTTTTGHVAMAHTDRRGHAGTAWYRGPCTPVKVSRDPAGAPFHVADQARRVGGDGREDLSLASAFEVGRLLAMSDPQFLASLRRWARRSFAFTRDRSLLDDVFRFDPGLLAGTRNLDLGRILAIDILTPGGIGGDPLDIIGHPLPIHPDGPLVQPADINVLATGLGVSQTVVRQLAGAALSDQLVEPGLADGGLADAGDGLAVLDGLRDRLDGAVLDRAGRVADLANRVGAGADLGLLNDILGGRQ